MRRGVLWHATAKTFFGGIGAEAAQRSLGGRTWILPREPLDHRCNEGHRRRRDGGRDGGHGHKGFDFRAPRAAPARRKGRPPAKPQSRRQRRGPGGRGAEHRGPRCPRGASCASRCRRNSRPQRMPPGRISIVPARSHHKGKLGKGGTRCSGRLNRKRRYPAPSITLPKRSQLCPLQRCNCICRITL